MLAISIPLQSMGSSGRLQSYLITFTHKRSNRFTQLRRRWLVRVDIFQYGDKKSSFRIHKLAGTESVYSTEVPDIRSQFIGAHSQPIPIGGGLTVRQSMCGRHEGPGFRLQQVAFRNRSAPDSKV